LPYTRCTISCNEQPDDLKILPVSVDGICDKMVTFWCKNPGVFPLVEQGTAFLEEVHEEFPAFINYLLNFEIPSELKQNDEYQRCDVPGSQSTAEGVNPEKRCSRPPPAVLKVLEDVHSVRAVTAPAIGLSRTSFTGKHSQNE
jgi:hypothetical protein